MPLACLSPAREFQPAPGRREVQLLPLVRELLLAKHALHRVRDHLLGQCHHLLVVRVGPVELQLRELRVVLEGHAFVAEVAADLVDAFQVADQQALEIQLERDAQVHVLLQLVVMRDERPRGRAAVQRLQHRRLHLQEAVRVQELAQSAYDSCTTAEHLAHVGIDSQVRVALAGAQLRIFQARVPHDRAVRQRLILVRWQRADGLGQHAELPDLQRDLAGLGAEHACRRPGRNRRCRTCG